MSSLQTCVPAGLSTQPWEKWRRLRVGAVPDRAFPGGFGSARGPSVAFNLAREKWAVKEIASEKEMELYLKEKRLDLGLVRAFPVYLLKGGPKGLLSPSELPRPTKLVLLGLADCWVTQQPTQAEICL